MNALLIIDAQNSFCFPGDKQRPKGELYVPGAETDMQILAQWLNKNKNEIDFILVTLDTHHYNDISHPNFWRDEQGKAPQPFTQISFSDVIDGKWIPQFDAERVKKYLHRLEIQGEYKHTIWPEHCLIGSFGAALYEPVHQALKKWSAETNKNFFPLFKGMYEYSEHFGAFAAQVAFDDVPETLPNTKLLDKLLTFDTIFISGEAKSHCVATTIKQMLNYNSAFAKKMIILEDTMSNVPGFENIADEIYEEAMNLGASVLKTTEIKF